jgi:hypothetical protein
MANCIYETFYCTDNPIVVGSVLLSNNTAPYVYVPAGFYATEVNTGLGFIYETDSAGNVINIYTPDNSICANNVPPPPPPPPITYAYYNARSYSCGACGAIVEYLTVSADDRYPLTRNKFYRQSGVSNSPFSYQIIDTGSGTGLEPILDPTTYNTCELACVII